MDTTTNERQIIGFHLLTDPNEMKEYAGKKHFDGFMAIKDLWERRRMTVVHRAVKAKFSQNKDIQELLLSTGGALLCECAGKDLVWGIGINYKVGGWEDEANWKGENCLGRVTMMVREEIMLERILFGGTDYVEYRDAPAIDAWKTPAGQLRRIPQYHDAVCAYADQMTKYSVRKAFQKMTLSDAEADVRGGSLLPKVGFFDMKQEVYERARILGRLAAKA